jgi:hypothetical protein
MRTRMLTIALSVMMGGLVLSPAGNASEWDKKTILTFRDQVQVPGAVLDPGTYVIRRTNPGGNPDIVSFMSKDEMHVYATAKAIPTERPNPADRPMVTFAETRTGQPEALKKWYYPGDLTGEEFIYPKNQGVLMSSARELRGRSDTISDSQVAVTPVPETKAPETKSNDMSTAQMDRDENMNTAPMNQEPVETAQNTNPAPSSNTTTTRTETTTTQSQSNTDANANRLPQTASDVPLFALIGGSALFLGFGLRKLAKENS